MTSLDGYHSGLLTGDTLADRLERDILDGRLPPGSRLPSERALSVEFGVSRSVSRDAMRSLRERGLVTAHVGRGTFVRELTPDGGAQSVEALARAGRVTASDLIVARTMLESEAAALAAEAHDAQDAQRLTQTLAAFNAATSLEVRAALDARFHEGIATASHNTVIRLMFGSIRPLVVGMILRSLTDRRVSDAGEPIHQDILDAILDRDARAARTAMTEHMNVARRYYGDDLDVPLAAVLRDATSVGPEVSRLLNEAAAQIASDDRPEGEAGR